MSKKRRIIYVDATTINKENSKISLYDTGNNLTAIMELPNVSNNNKAELYGVLYAVLYAVKNDYKNCHVLCDNLHATQNKKVTELCQKYSVSLSWIPREVNVIADKVVKLEPTVKVKEWYILKMFCEVIGL